MTVAVVALLVAATGCTSGDEATDTTTTTTASAAPTTVAITTSTTSTTQPTTTSTTTTSTLPEPPHLEVLDPAHGATVTTARYTFTGITDPGCTVTVGGKYEAAVEEDGSWALDLVLEPGRNSTTFTATHPETGLETSEAIRVYYADAVELLGDGLGAVSFGQDEATTMEILVGLLGPPVTESTCSDLDFCTGMGYGWCSYIHHAHWPDQELSIVIADCEDREGRWPDAPELISWFASSGSPLTTPEGVGPGSTLADLRRAYGDRLRVGYDDCGGGFTFRVMSFDAESAEIFGRFAWPPGLELPEDFHADPEEVLQLLDPSTRSTSFQGGVGQSC